MAAEQPTIALVPVGEVPAGLLEALIPTIEERFPGRTARVVAGLPVPEEAYVPARRQYEAGPILDRLARRQNGAERVLGIAGLDLFAPGLNFIFGQAQVSGPVAVMALPRLRPDFYGKPSDWERLVQRACKEAVHELGHTYGLAHCPIPTCVMHFSNTLAETDRKSDRFCPRHEAQLLRALDDLSARGYRAAGG